MGRAVYYDRKNPEYPERLRKLERMPGGLYVLGTLPKDSSKSVAVVGARACSAYGRQEAIRFSRALAARGVQIISGLAYGIDAWAHHGALEWGGKTFAVLGSGVDVCYPRANYPLYRRILQEGGGILSEFEPGTRPEPWHFPIRNRIISGLADLVLVIEARSRSGSLITADYALEQGKSVYAVPGRTGDELSEGCNELISQGAGIACSPASLLEELGIFAGESEENAGTDGDISGGRKENLPKNLQIVYNQLAGGEKSLEELRLHTGLPMGILSNVILELQLKGWIRELYPGRYARRR